MNTAVLRQISTSSVIVTDLSLLLNLALYLSLSQNLVLFSIFCFFGFLYWNFLLSPSQSLSLSLSLANSGFVLHFLFLWIFKLEFSIIISVRNLGKCEVVEIENVFFEAFSQTQQNTQKYFLKHFLRMQPNT